jgi:AcrR family transcriptional regulator
MLRADDLASAAEERMRRVIPDEQILDAALRVIAEHGYRGASTQQIAHAAGINGVTLFRRYGSKKAILLAAAAREAERLGAGAIQHTGDLAADLTRIVDVFAHQAHTRGRVIAALLSELPRQPELADVVQYPVRVAHGVAGILARYQASGELRPGPPLQLLMALLGPIMMRAIAGNVLGGDALPPLDSSAHVAGFLAGHRSSTGAADATTLA